MCPYTQKEKVQAIAKGSPFSFARPKVEPSASERELVSVLKKLITEANVKSDETGKERKDERYVNLRIALAYSSETLKNVVDGNVHKPEVNGALRNAINALVNTLY